MDGFIGFWDGTNNTDGKAAYDTFMKVRQVPGINYGTCVLFAALEAADLLEDMDEDRLRGWTDLALRIEEAMGASDEARFTLYDYLDAVINCPPGMDDAFRDARDSGDREALLNQLVAMAEAKRGTYSI